MLTKNELALQEFYDELERHDWFYFYSDDRRAYSAGQSNETKLSNKSTTNPEFRKLYVAYKDWKNSNGAVLKPARPGGPKPEKPLFKDELF